MSREKRRRRRLARKAATANTRQPPAPLLAHQRITNVARACEALDCSRDRLYDLLKSGEIESFLDGRSRKIVVASLDAYIARRVEASNKRWERARYYLHNEQRQAGKGADAASP
jgi:excisionase family DNA binding protein